MTKNYVDKLPDDAVKVKGALNWATPNGDIYGIETRTIPDRNFGKVYKHGKYGQYFKCSTYLFI